MCVIIMLICVVVVSRGVQASLLANGTAIALHTRTVGGSPCIEQGANCTCELVLAGLLSPELALHAFK